MSPSSMSSPPSAESTSLFSYASASYATRNNISSSCNRKGGRRNTVMKMNRSSSSSSSSSSSLLVLRVLVVTTISLFLLCCCFGGGGGGGYQGSNMLFANALSMSSSSSSSSSTSSTTSATTTSATTTTTTKNRIEYFDPDIADANNDQLLIAIQECRRTSFPPEKKNFMDAERDFIAAKTVTSKKKLCAIIFDNDDDNNPNPNPRILGTADLQPQYNYINKEKVYIPKGIISNVFVRPDQRGKKFGQQLMIDGVENILIKQLVLKLDDETSVNDASRNGVKLTLDVYTQNKPALQLYLKLGYTPDGPVNDGVYKMSQLFNSNLFITLTKTIQV